MESLLPRLLKLIRIIWPIFFMGLFVGQALSIIYIFGYWNNMPKWLRITTGIFQALTIAITVSIILNPSFC